MCLQKYRTPGGGAMLVKSGACYTHITSICYVLIPVMLSPRGQSGLEAKILASASTSASKLWPRPRPRGFDLGIASISLSYYVMGHFSSKNRVKLGNFVIFSGNNVKSYVVNHYSVLFRYYFLASASASTS